VLAEPVVNTAAVAAAPAALSAAIAAPGVSERTARIETALNTLSGYVAKQSHSDALRMAFQAYFNFKAAHPEQVRNPYLYFVDYGLDSRTPRGYVFDMESLKLVDGPFTVAHGRGSSRSQYGVPMSFSNGSGSYESSLGLFLTQDSYGFTGHTGGSTYSSIGLRLEGLSGRFNDQARSRGVVVHGAPYVTPAGSGRSQGCPAMEQGRAQHLIPKIANGGLVFLFSPNNDTWLHNDPWANGGTSGEMVAAK
jgi:hypothetical protein